MTTAQVVGNSGWQPVTTVCIGARLMYEGQSQVVQFYADLMARFRYLAHANVIDLTNTIPGSPAVGAMYIVGSSPTGVWADNAGDLALWHRDFFGAASVTDGWVFTARCKGMVVFDDTLNDYRTATSSGWLTGLS